ncbi:MAG TPA: S41 family peptidase [Cytophagaceae bacterium]|jgi:hypothetical protein
MKSNIQLWVATVCLAILISSCQKLFIEPNAESSVEQNFEIFWNDLNNTYPYFKRDNVDWQAVYDKYRPQVTSSTSKEKLAYIFTEMLTPLSDQHMSITTPFGSWSHPRPHYEDNYDEDVVHGILNQQQKPILGPDFPDETKTIEVGEYGIINRNGNDYIYFRIETFLTKHSFERTLDSIINHNINAKGIILDVRNNLGGSIATLINLMGTFTSAPESRFITYALVKEKVGPLEDSYGLQQAYPIFKNAYTTYTKPVALLTNRYSISAAEHASLAMRKISKGFIVGDTTFGATSFIVQRTLPNGFSYTSVNSITTDPQGKIYEKIGVPPTITVKTTPGNDEIIDRAIVEINNR